MLASAANVHDCKLFESRASFEAPGQVFHRPASLAELLELRAAHPDAGRGAILRHAGLLLVSLLPIVLLSKSLAAILDHGIKALGGDPPRISVK